MRRPSYKFRRCTCVRIKIENKKPNMVVCYEQNWYVKIDARDGREWDALLRASARNPAAHSDVFGEFKCKQSSSALYVTHSHIVEWGFHQIRYNVE